MTTPTQPHVMPTYPLLPIAMSHGQGAWAWDTAGRKYLDALGGVAVNTLGHNHPRLVAALQDQVAKMIHCGNYFHVPGQEAVAAKLCELSGLTNAFFCNSGLEANEAAIKLARKFGHDKGIHNPQVVVYEKAFHGRSIATLSATGNPKVQKGFEPLVEGFVRVPMNDIEALKAATAGNDSVCAVMLETIQGEGGINPARAEYLQAVRALCDARDWLFIIDEVQCGMGRTGKWFAHQWAGIKPDVMAMAKGLASGVPIGAVVAGERAAKIFGYGNHGSTFGGNPLAMRAALETIHAIEDEDLMGNATRMGDVLRTELVAVLGSLPIFKEIRGQGLMLGVELTVPCGELLGRCAEAGLLLSITAERVIRFIPPLVVNEAEIREMVRVCAEQVKKFAAEKGLL